jgi:hypothetical protein
MVVGWAPRWTGQTEWTSLLTLGGAVGLILPSEGHQNLLEILCDLLRGLKYWFAIFGGHSTFGLEAIFGFTLFLKLLCQKGIVTADFWSIVFTRFVPLDFATFTCGSVLGTAVDLKQSLNDLLAVGWLY